VPALALGNLGLAIRDWEEVSHGIFLGSGQFPRFTAQEGGRKDGTIQTLGTNSRRWFDPWNGVTSTPPASESAYARIAHGIRHLRVLVLTSTRNRPSSFEVL
jgi:hypothetical protein